MKILCDTCCVLMLIRFAPDMFVDESYNCLTITQARKEIFRTQKFKSKYPWRDQFKDKIQCLRNSDLTDDESYNDYLNVINLLINNNTVNGKTEKLFDLSAIDRAFLACALSKGYQMTTGDSDIKDLAIQEFSETFKGSISPLGIINKWLREGLIEWDKTFQNYLLDWTTNNEDPQPKRQRVLFKKLTGFRYVGS
jgi:hypothetical protein